MAAANASLGDLRTWTHHVDHAQLDTPQPVGTPVNGWSARRKGHYLHDTQQTQETNIATLSGVRTCDSINQATADRRLRPLGHQDRLLNSLTSLIFGDDSDNGNGFKDVTPSVWLLGFVIWRFLFAYSRISMSWMRGSAERSRQTHSPRIRS